MAHSTFPINTRRALLAAAIQLSVIPVGLGASQSIAHAAPKPKASAAALASAAQGKALINAVQTKIENAKTIGFTSVVTLTGIGSSASSPSTITFSQQRPNLYSLHLIEAGKEIFKAVSSTEGGYGYDFASDQYIKTEKAGAPGDALQKTVRASASLLSSGKLLAPSVLASFAAGSHPFSDQMFTGGVLPSQTRLYPGQLNGEPVSHVVQTWLDSKSKTTIDVYVNPRTSLPVRYAVHTSAQGLNIGLQIDFSDFTLGDTPFPASTFDVTPPATAKLWAPPTETETPATAKGSISHAVPEEQPILAAGALAPDFAVQDVTGKTAHLADFSGKVVVLDFWSTWCGPCQASLPDTDKLAKKYKGKDVVFLPVCSWDDKSAFTPWVKARKNWTMKFYFDPAGRGAKNIATGLYQVSGIPTQFVIGKDGKVEVGFVGYDGAEGEAKLSKAIDKALAGS